MDFNVRLGAREMDAVNKLAAALQGIAGEFKRLADAMDAGVEAVGRLAGPAVPGELHEEIAGANTDAKAVDEAVKQQQK